MKKRRRWSLLLVLILLLSAGIYFSGKGLEAISGKLVEPKINSYIVENGSLELYFCPHEDCETALLNFLGSAKESIHCALFEVDLESVKSKLREKANYLEVKVVTDNDYLDQFDHPFVKADSWGLMHNNIF